MANMRISIDRRGFLRSASAALAAAQAIPKAAAAGPEWRNKQPDMAYRRLGRTNLMVSEFVSGGDPIRSDNYDHLSEAVERGLNYLDMAPQYGRGDCEIAYGKFLAGSSAKRDKVFLTTKISRYSGVRNTLYKEIYDGLPGEKQRAIRGRAQRMLSERGAAKPGYYLDYFPGQMNAFEPNYLSNAMIADYRHKVEGAKRFREFIEESIDGSLKRVGTDHFDIMMCPHGTASAEELDIHEIKETFDALKRKGKVRFLGLTAHNDPAGVLRKATELGHFDVMMLAYNCINGGYVEEAIQNAVKRRDMGIIAMKAAMAVATHHKSLQPTPQWRIDKIHRLIAGNMKAPMKAYLWALNNPNLTAVISNLWNPQFIRENLSLAGKKVELRRA